MVSRIRSISGTGKQVKKTGTGLGTGKVGSRNSTPTATAMNKIKTPNTTGSWNKTVTPNTKTAMSVTLTPRTKSKTVTKTTVKPSTASAFKKSNTVRIK